MSTYKLLIVDDHYVVREGLKLIVETSEHYEVAGEAANGKEALTLLQTMKPDVILMDLNMPVMGGLDAMRALKAQNNAIPVIILTTYNEDELMVAGLALGANGYLLKDTSRENLFRTIESAIRGETLLSADMMERVIAARLPVATNPAAEDASLLSEKESYVLRCVAKGFRSKEIAFDLGISERTVKAHLTSIYNKLGVDSRSQAVAAAMERGILPR
ncbi:response regulator transcription factor [Gorillibacterium sp. CAU 1737]|uniref:response regulator transcription factor n=1 Tax=Gorillibacterium sp. CAU 1737 TaxID=3140362 RepID=UPI00326024E3